MRSVIAALILALGLTGHGRAADLGQPLSHGEALEVGLISNEEADGLFKLWNECRTIAFGVHLQGEDQAKQIGLTKERIETVVRSRLRGARVFRTSPDLSARVPLLEKNGFLQVQVHLGGNYVLWSIRFEKVMKDLETDIVGWADTGWESSAFGGHNNDGNSILASVSPGIDEFIDDYLRVNEPAC